MRNISLGDDITIKYHGAEHRSKIFEIFNIRGISYARIMKEEDGLVMAKFADIWWENSNWNVLWEDTIQKVGHANKN